MSIIVGSMFTDLSEKNWQKHGHGVSVSLPYPLCPAWRVHGVAGCIYPRLSTLNSQYLLPMAHAETQAMQFLEANLSVAGQRKPRETKRTMSRALCLTGCGDLRSFS